jgi:hypothetical protein
MINMTKYVGVRPIAWFLEDAISDPESTLSESNLRSNLYNKNEPTIIAKHAWKQAVPRKAHAHTDVGRYILLLVHRVFPGKMLTLRGEGHREHKKEYEHTRPAGTCMALILKGRLGLQKEAHRAFGDQISPKEHGAGCILSIAPHVNRDLLEF